MGSNSTISARSADLFNITTKFAKPFYVYLIDFFYFNEIGKFKLKKLLKTVILLSKVGEIGILTRYYIK